MPVTASPGLALEPQLGNGRLTSQTLEPSNSGQAAIAKVASLTFYGLLLPDLLSVLYLLPAYPDILAAPHQLY